MFIKKYKDQENGTTSIDYSLIAVGISITIMVVVFTMGDSVSAMFNQALDALTN